MLASHLVGELVHVLVKDLDLLRFILAKKGVTVVNYIDDIIGICPENLANEHFHIVYKLLNDIGLQINHEKTVPPSHTVVCLGITVDTKIGHLCIPSEKLNNVLIMCTQYLKKKKFTRTQLQSLIGSLIFLI
jgi:hypothetical protein